MLLGRAGLEVVVVAAVRSDPDNLELAGTTDF
jgi:hypothetical protein